MVNGHATEGITLASLDEFGREYGWSGIDFVKMDAEGEESRIIRGGAEFLNRNSPLIQFEVKAEYQFHLDLVHEFKAVGYSSYRLVPGLGLLVPFEVGEPMDPFLLNLFYCKPDRAQQLSAQGLLVSWEDHVRPAWNLAQEEAELSERWNPDRRFDWQTSLTGFPYAQTLAPSWTRTVSRGGSEMVEHAQGKDRR